MRSLLCVPLLATSFSLQSEIREGSSKTELSSVEAMGACEVRPEAVACWDMAGHPSVELVDGIRAALSNGNEASFRLGKKNRYLAVSHSQMISVNYRTSDNPNLYPGISTNGERRIDYLKIAVSPSETSLAIQAQTMVVDKTEATIRLREGEHATVDGREVEVGASVKIVPKKEVPGDRRYVYNYGYPNVPPGSPSWNVVLGIKGREGDFFSWGFTPLDDQGEPIRYVDAQGRPIPPIRALALEPNIATNVGYGPSYGGNDPGGTVKLKAVVATFQGQSSAPAFRATTTIDPKYIASLRVKISHQQTTDLGPFPLDPQLTGPK